VPRPDRDMIAAAADHRWIAGTTNNAKAQAAKYSDVTFNAVAAGKDVPEQRVAGDTDPAEARRGRAAPARRRRDDGDRPQGDGRRHPGHNLDREFSEPLAYQTLIGATTAASVSRSET
jgi:ribose transport system substrate-binding protein